MKAGIH